MICKSCSAEYDDNILVCPYCGSENKEAVRELKEDILESYDKEAEQIRKSVEQYPERTARRWTKYIVYVVAAILALGVVIGITAIPLGKLSVGVEHKREQKHIKKLEELYLSGDFEAVDEYLDEKNLYDSVYEKYTEIARVYTYCSYMKNDMLYVEEVLSSEMTDADKKEHARSWCENILQDAAVLLRMTAEYREDMQFLGNETELEAFGNEAIGQLTEFGYTEEEILQISKIEGEDVPTELLDKLTKYYLE